MKYYNHSSKFNCPYFVFLFCLSLSLVGCDFTEKFSHESLIDKLKKKNIETPDESSQISSKHLIENLPYYKADGFNEYPEFFVSGRTHALKQFSCTQCHSGSTQTLNKEAKGEKQSHWDIKILHADSDTMNCSTCHSSISADHLNTLKGKLIGFDQSYQICSQCHMTQAKDWAGGAHGKRLGGWVPPRIVQNCTGCHNPHQPAFEKRRPLRANRLPGDTKIKINKHKE